MNDTAMKFDLQLFADPSAALNNTSGTMTIKGGATLNHPTTKAVNVKGGKVLVESATIFSDKYAIYAAKGTAEVNKANVTVIGTGTMTEDGGTIIRK